jgi:hypothetical protein
MACRSEIRLMMTRDGLVRQSLSTPQIIKVLTAKVANHTSTPNPTPPATYPVLYADEYGESTI